MNPLAVNPELFGSHSKKQTRLSTVDVARSSTVTLHAVPEPEAVIILLFTNATKSPGPGLNVTAGISAWSFPEIIIASACTDLIEAIKENNRVKHKPDFLMTNTCFFYAELKLLYDKKI
ncbi:hypothetical protein OIPHN330_53270 (plasmid) [Citrobacter freundii]|nr:hypothetical protein OIPHN330_53270 [Citrobacter freundii]BEJ42664.1 hypothetical protein OIPHN354_53760 [Citrobacter freundii]